MKRSIIFLALLVVFLAPTALSFAAVPIVPCDGPDCQACSVIELGNRLIAWFVGIMASICGIALAVAGFKMVTAGGSSEAISSARSMLTNVIIGFIILLSSWLIIDTIMKMFLDPKLFGTEGKYGPWNEIKCVAQPGYSWSPSADGSRGVSGSSPTAQTLPAAVAAVGTYKSQLCGIAQNAGIGGDCASLEAIMTQESGGNPNAVSSMGALGLMQVMPAAARSLDPSLKNLSDAEVRQKLLDPTYNMQVAVAYYSNVAKQVGATNYDSIYAAYNGGMNAIQPSKDCPGMQKWQCEWDNPQHTIPNTGYKETRDYVAKVNQYRQMYAKP